jgi:SAM-dependent methyltransferase
MDPTVYERMAAHEDRHWWFVARRRILDRLIARVIDPRGDCKILEAGCGTGGNLSMLGRFGRAAAFEPDANARALASAKSTLEVREGALPDRVPFAPDSFDLVAMLDVLEHVDDDVGSLKAVAERLARGGRLLLTVPAYGFLWSRHDELHHHKRRYRKGDLLGVAKAAGLQPEYVSYFNTLLFPLIAAKRLAGRLLGDSGKADDEMPPAGLNRLLGAVFAVERHLLGRVTLPFGVSLVMVARRS